MNHEIELDADQIRLLGDVKAGKVHRHRLGRSRSPALGEDFQEAPGHGPGDLRKARSRLAKLQRLGLVVLPAVLDRDEKWPWKTTELGDLALEAIASLAGEDPPAALEAP